MMVRLAPATVAIVAFFGAALLPRATWPLIDPDVWWHIRAGRDVLETGVVPRVDTWSLIAAGRPWTSQDWLANVLLAFGDRIGTWGHTLLSLLFAAFALMAFAILWKAASLRAGVGWLSRVAWLSAGLVLAGPTLGVRVQVFDLLFAAAVIWILWRVTANGSGRWTLALIPISLAWVNVHAGWPLLFLLGGAVLVGEGIDRLTRREIVPPPLAWRQLAMLAAGLAAAAATLVLNPNGPDIYGYPLQTLELGALKAAIGEWQPARPDSLFGWLWIGFVVVGVIPTLVFARRRLRMADALILLGLTAMAAMAVRFLLVLGPMGGLIIAVNLGPELAATRVGRARSPIIARLSSRRRSAVLPALVGVLVFVGVGLSFARAAPPSQAAELEVEQPVAAVEWILDEDPGDRVFNRYEWGGYVGLHQPSEPIYIDGRADVYGDDLIEEYVRTIGLTVDPQSTFDRHDIDYVLFPPDTPLAGWLNADAGWQRAYEDATAVVWTRVEDAQ
jgi:hypothetical protein